MHRPRIGIPLSLDDRGRWRAERTYHYIDRSYADAIDRAGGVALHLPIQSDVAGLVDAIDGLLLPGGDDFPSDAPLAPEIEALLDLVPAAHWLHRVMPSVPVVAAAPPAMPAHHH